MNEINNLKVDHSTQFAILGLGTFGMSIAKVLGESGFNVLACDINPKKVHEVAPFITQAVEGDINDSSVLDSLELEDFDVVIIAISESFETSIITAMIIKEKGVPFIISKADNWRQQKILKDIGANLVVLPEKEMGEKIAHNIISNNPLKRLSSSDEYQILEILVEPNWIGKSLMQLKLREKYSINVIAIIRGDSIIAVLTPEFILEKDDIIVVFGLS